MSCTLGCVCDPRTSSLQTQNKKRTLATVMQANDAITTMYIYNNGRTTDGLTDGAITTDEHTMHSQS